MANRAPSTPEESSHLFAVKSLTLKHSSDSGPKAFVTNRINLCQVYLARRRYRASKRFRKSVITWVLLKESKKMKITGHEFGTLVWILRQSSKRPKHSEARLALAQQLRFFVTNGLH